MYRMTKQNETSKPASNKGATPIPADMTISRVDHLPIISAYCRKMGLVQIVNTLVPTRMNVDVGTIVMALVIDTLSGRNPLYRLPEFFEHVDRALILGQDLAPEALNDSNVGRGLDKIYEAGTSKVFSQVAAQATKIWNVKANYVHFDTTSVNVWGDYRPDDSELIEGESGPILITYGHSKDHRPDLKQIMMEMLCVSSNIPIYGECVNGNASDKTQNTNLLKRIGQILARHGYESDACIYIADSALVTKANLHEMGSNLFITRLPFNYNVADEAVAEAVARDQWTDVGAIALARSTPNRPVAEYRLCETAVELYGKPYRAVVVHSSSHDKRRHKRIDRETAKEQKRLADETAAACKQEYFCRADAEAAARLLEKKVGPYHRITTSVIERPCYAKGRPRLDQPRTVKKMVYILEARLEENTETIDRKRAEAGCFVLLSNVPIEGEMAHSPEQILRAYKEQHGIERNFSFLKDPMIVNDMFLKSPSRIEALGMVLMISLLVWNLMERSMRQSVKEMGGKIPGWGRQKTERPTSFMMSTVFLGLMIIRHNDAVLFTRPLTKKQQTFLKILCLDINDLLNLPPPRSPENLR